MRIELAGGHTALADDADMELLLPYSWHVHKSGSGRPYVAARVRGDGPPYKRIKMHRLIMNPPAGMVVHHINNDGLDNRRCNLEVTTGRRNLRYHFDAATQGAYLDKGSGKWRAQVRGNDGKRVFLGLFDLESDAKEAAREFRQQRSQDPDRTGKGWDIQVAR